MDSTAVGTGERQGSEVLKLLFRKMLVAGPSERDCGNDDSGWSRPRSLVPEARRRSWLMGEGSAVRHRLAKGPLGKRWGLELPGAWTP